MQNIPFLRIQSKLFPSPRHSAEYRLQHITALHISAVKYKMVESQANSDHTIYDDERTIVNVNNPEAAIDDGDLGGERFETRDSAAGKSSHENQLSQGLKDVEKVDPVGDEAASAAADPNIVDWDGPGDPKNPRNWSKGYKMLNIALISASVLYCNIATTMFAPGANIMAREFDLNNQTIEILTITIASLGFAMGLFFAPLSEVFGRVPIYRVACICYIGFTVGCSRSTNVAEFLVFRLLTGLSASPFMTTGGGTIADLLEKEQRGGAMAMFTLGPLIGPVCCYSSLWKNEQVNFRARWSDLL
jgi:hypothetical protein